MSNTESSLLPVQPALESQLPLGPLNEADQQRLNQIEHQQLADMSQVDESRRWRVQFENGGSRLLDNPDTEQEHKEFIDKQMVNDAVSRTKQELNSPAHADLKDSLHQDARQQLADENKAASTNRLNKALEDIGLMATEPAEPITPEEIHQQAEVTFIGQVLLKRMFEAFMAGDSQGVLDTTELAEHLRRQLEDQQVEHTRAA